MTSQIITQQQVQAIEEVKRSYIPLLRELIVGGRKLTDDQIIGRAAFAASQGLDPLSEVHTITDRDGKTMSHSMHINGLRRKNQEQVGPECEITVQFVKMAKEELPQGALYGYECYLRDGQSYGLWQKRLVEVGHALREALGGPVTFQDVISLVGPSPVSVGVGIVYTRELSEYKDQNYNPIERCKKRAELNARHHRFSTVAPVYEGSDMAGALVIEGMVRDVTEPAGGNGKPRPAAVILGELGFGEAEALGIGDPEEIDTPAPPANGQSQKQPPAKPPLMTLATAEAVESSDGTRYGDLPVDRLSYMANSIAAQLKKNGLTPEQVETYQLKLDAIKTILASRKTPIS